MERGCNRHRGGSTHRAELVTYEFSVSCRAINLNTISAAPYRNIMQKTTRIAATRGGDVYAERATLASRTALIFRERAAHNAGILPFFIFSKDAARRAAPGATSGKGENGGHMYVRCTCNIRDTTCVHVRKTLCFNLENGGRGAARRARVSDEKEIYRSGCGSSR